MDGRTEFIGENITISHHSDPSLCGVSGMIIDETRETVVIDSNGLKKTVSKRPAKFMFESGEIIGSKIAYRPQDRIKKVKA
jgi:ribonuclease P protein subunit POP4